MCSPAGGNVLILNIWGAQAGPIMQALHFSFAVGAFVSPIIAKLVFGKHHAKAANSTLDASSPLADKMVQTLNSLIHFSPGNSEALSSMFAYFVIGAFILFLSLAFFILYSCGTPSKDRSQSASGAPLVAKRHNVLICLLAIFFFWYVGAEVAYGSFIFTYAKDYANMTQDESAGLNSLFWGTFAATRGLAIFFAACLYPGTMILLSLVGCTVSSFLLTRFHKNRLALWSCTALYGASMATTFPSGISWVEQYTTLTGRSASVFVVGAALGEMVLPAVLGFLLGNATLQQYPLLMILCLLTAVVTSILFPVMYKLAAAPTTPAGKRPRVRGREADDGEDRKALLDSGGNEDDDEEEEADEGDEEADHWNDADFEVIEMDDASLMSSPNKVASPPDVTMSAAAVPSIDPFSLPALSESPSKYVSSSPRRKLLVTLDREKND